MSLTLFKNITEELTELEIKTLVPMLLDILSATNENNRFKNKQLCGWLKACGYDVTDVRIRKMVNYIRVMNIAKPKVLIGAQNGYFLTEHLTIVDDQIESMEGRVNSMVAAIDAMKAQRTNLKFSH